MNPNLPDYIAVDIAKASLRLQSHSTGLDIENNESGFKELLAHVGTLSKPLIVMEATGGYEQPLMRFLIKKGVAMVLVNPARVRSFAASEGQKAKTDRIDAEVLLSFARSKKLRRMPTPAPHQVELTELMDRRDQLAGEIAREKNRLEKQPQHTQASIKKVMRLLERERGVIEKRIEAIIRAHEDMASASEAMQGVAGVGKITAWTLLTHLPEMNRINRNQLVALAGLAPYNRDSGKTNGKRRICAGRAKVRKCLYMATMTAAIHNEHIKAYVERLRSKGKPYRCAIVAAMRKLLLHLQSILKKQEIMLAS
jgi:transposase